MPFEFDAETTALDALHRATEIFTRSRVVSDLLNKLEWPLPGQTLLDPSAGIGHLFLEP